MPILIKKDASNCRKAQGFPVRRSIAIRVISVEVSADGEELRNGRELVPSARVGHFPTQPVNASSHGQPGGVVGGRGQVHKRPGQRVRFIPPIQISHFERLMYVGQTRAVNRGAKDDESCLGEMYREFRILGEW